MRSIIQAVASIVPRSYTPQHEVLSSLDGYGICAEQTFRHSATSCPAEHDLFFWTDDLTAQTRHKGEAEYTFSYRRLCKNKRTRILGRARRQTTPSLLSAWHNR